MTPTAPEGSRVSRWRQPRALIGLGLLAFGYWGTVALFNIERPAPRRCETVNPDQAPRRWHYQWRHHEQAPRLRRAQPRPLYIEPVWSPYPRPRTIGLAYGTPDPLLLLDRAQ
jgi:hypothetical protein